MISVFLHNKTSHKIEVIYGVVCESAKAWRSNLKSQKRQYKNQKKALFTEVKKRQNTALDNLRTAP